MAETLLLAMVALSTVAPSLLLLWYFHARDAFPEPPRVLWATFGLGVATIAPVLALGWPADHLTGMIADPVARGFADAFLVAAIPEELCKLLVLVLYVMRHSEFDEPMDGVVYGVAAGLGFATFENVVYIADGGMPVAILRALTAVPGHAFLGAIMGHYVARARFDENRRRRWLLWAFTVPMILHGLYDFPLLTAGEINEGVDSEVFVAYLLLPLAPAILIFEGIWSVRLVRRQRRAQLEQVAATTAPPPVPVPPAPVPLAAAPAVVPGPREATGRPGRTGAWVLTILGGLVASAGGLVSLGVLLGVLVGVEIEDAAALVFGTVLLGVLPLGMGAGLFAWGVRRLNRASR